jgi:hypothetical protein
MQTFSPPQQAQLLPATSSTTSSRGKCGGNAPRLILRRRAGLSGLAAWLFSSDASVADSVCSTSSSANASWSGSSCSARRPKRWRCSASMIAVRRSIS